MASKIRGSIRIGGVADAAAIAAVHVEAWRETYVGIVPLQVLAGLSVDRRTDVWRRLARAAHRRDEILTIAVARRPYIASIDIIGKKIGALRSLDPSSV